MKKSMETGIVAIMTKIDSLPDEVRDYVAGYVAGLDDAIKLTQDAKMKLKGEK